LREKEERSLSKYEKSLVDCLKACFEFTSFFTVIFPRRVEEKKDADVPVNKRQQWFLNRLGAGMRNVLRMS
jgi:hypothetical protein